MGISTFVQTLSLREAGELQVHVIDSHDERIREVLEAGIDRRRETFGRAPADGDGGNTQPEPEPEVPYPEPPADLLHAASESLAGSFLKYTFDPAWPETAEGTVLLEAPPGLGESDGVPQGATHYELEVHSSSGSSRRPVLPDPEHKWLVHESWSRRVPAADSEEEEVEEDMRPRTLGSYESPELAWTATCAFEASKLKRGFVPHLHPDDRQAFGMLPAVTARSLFQPRPHVGPAVLDLDKAAEAVCFTACRALELGLAAWPADAPCARPKPEPHRTHLLGCFAHCDIVVGSDVCYGPVRLFFPAQVELLARMLEAVSDDAFVAAWTPTADDWPAVLGGLSKEQLQTDADREYVLAHARALRHFARSAAARTYALVVHHW
jgi:hypothetical protein